jgi:4,5-DOPA dioxygenase extradiol
MERIESCSRQHSFYAMAVSTLPALFVSHGAPLFAIEPGSTGPALAKWARTLVESAVRPLRGIVVMSPHWEAVSPSVMANPAPATWHDFGGFPSALYQLRYPAPGSPVLAAEVIQLLGSAGIEAAPDTQRPLDHGAWVPLMHLFPDAQVPVVQVALPLGYGPAEVFAMGQALRSLRARDVLVMGSGSMTHNLSEFFGAAHGPAAYVTAFSRWIEDALSRGDVDTLLDYRRQAPFAAQAHPQEDHLLPLFFALGAADAQARPDYLSREVMYGMLAMDSFAFPSVQ